MERLAPEPGVRWLDVATGTGEVALRAARAGAGVTALDISARLLDQARAKARGLEIRWDEGDAQALPYGDGEFDVVSSNFGVIFAPDHAAAAAELGRVCAPGGRLGLTAWRPKPALSGIYSRFAPAPASDPDAWGEEERLRRLLGESFELEIEERTWLLEGASAEAVFEFMADAAPPMAALLRFADKRARRGFREALVDYWRGFEQADGGVVEPREYLLVLGRRR